MSPTDGSDDGDGDPIPADPSVDAGPGSSEDVEPSGSEGSHGPETASSDPDSDSPSLLDRLPFADDRVVQALIGIVVVGLVLRLLFLGDRTAHFDEGRVAYWIVHSVESGSFAYRRIIHGPLIQHVNRWLFPVLGMNDFTMRLPVAIIGAVLPLSALLFREHLRKIETVLLGAFLAFNPVLLYYSRFMRSDLLVATFMFVAMGLVVRFYDTREMRYLYLASAATALGFGSKENAIVYVLVWIGATVLLADQALYRPRDHDGGGSLLRVKVGGLWRDRVRPWLQSLAVLAWAVVGDRQSGAGARAADAEAAEGQTQNEDYEANGAGPRRGGDAGSSTPRWYPGERDPPTRAETKDAFWSVLVPLRYVWYALVIGLIFLGITIFLYAQRGAGMAGLQHPPTPPSEGALGLWEAAGNPALWDDLIVQTGSHTIEEFSRWFGSASDPGCHKDNVIDGWACYFGRFLEVLAAYAAPLSLFAIGGFLYERYGSGRSRNIVLFMTYAGVVAAIGYPLGTDVWGAWLVVHAVIPLAIPAAVGFALLFRWGYAAFAAEDEAGLAIATVAILLVAASAGVVVAQGVYINDQSENNQLVQFAQPGGDAKPALEAMAEISDRAEAPHLLIYHGEQGSSYRSNNAFVQEQESQFDRSGMAFYPMCTRFHNALPLPWYIAKDDVETICERDAADLRQIISREDPPPVIVTQGYDTTVPRDALAEQYIERTYQWRTYTRDTSFWIHEDYADTLSDR